MSPLLLVCAIDGHLGTLKENQICGEKIQSFVLNFPL